MMISLVSFLLGCTHRRTTFPITPLRSSKASGSAHSATYVACLDCGKELAYNWTEMRIEKAKAPQVAKTSPVEVSAQSFLSFNR